MDEFLFYLTVLTQLWGRLLSDSVKVSKLSLVDGGPEGFNG